MLTALNLLGWALPMPMGGWAPLTWGEIRAIAEATGRISAPWEYETARAMSEAYIAGLVEGRDLLSIPPIDRD